MGLFFKPVTEYKLKEEIKMKLMKVLFVAAIALAIAMPTFAAVQNIKVSGSVEERAIFMNNFDLRDTSEESTNFRISPSAGFPAVDIGSGNSINEDGDSFILSTIKVGVDSDLTDNVSASIVLSNQSEWGGWAGTGFDTGVVVNKAFVTLKEFFYQPLTLKVGRQDLMFGSGLVIGPGIFRDPTGAFVFPRADLALDRFDLAAGNIGYLPGGPNGQQYSVSTYYDAIRATLDLDPWTIDAIYSKISATNTAHADQDLAGINVAYMFDQYNAKAEAYYFFKNDESFNSDLGYIDTVDINNTQTVGALDYADDSVPGVGARIYERDQTHVFGMRGDIEPVENLTLSGEGAVQWGQMEDVVGLWNVSTDGSELNRHKLAWAIDTSGNYTWNEVSYKPNLGLGFVYLSGEESGNSGRYNAWDPMFKGKFYSMIRDYMAGQQASYNFIGGNIYQTLDQKDPSGSTDAITLYVDGGLQPMEDLSLKTRYLHFWSAAKPADSRSRSLGDEVDTTIVYDYTEDVQFDLTGGVFIPGSFYDDNNDEFTKSTSPAYIVTGGVKVAF